MKNALLELFCCMFVPVLMLYEKASMLWTNRNRIINRMGSTATYIASSTMGLVWGLLLLVLGASPIVALLLIFL